ncbi:MAG TPA: hypothetical protein EYN07_02360 [Flavobacteriaceae bacterium]|nr:hypothetical protein [Flavobacteriaceae bacterium]HIN98062.1 hypothetical protein [Flavobacteriaceae bacterium]
MTLSKGHSYDFTPKSLKIIDYLLPKLKFSVMPSKIVRWLENFEEKDLNYAYDFLQVFEYVNYTEFQYRLEDQLKSILNELDKKDKILVVPYGKLGKSATLVTYPLTHSDTYETLENEGRIYLSKDLELFKKKVDCVIFIDDFIGTGETFCNDYIASGAKSWCDSKTITKRYVLTAIVMEKGKEKIETSYPNITVKAQERHKLYKYGFSPFMALGKVGDYQSFSNRYESKSTMSHGHLNGYGNSQSIVAFTHCTPDNTIPIFWWDEDWFPLFPRENRTRMDDAKEFKKGIAFYIGICNRLKIDLLSLKKYEKASSKVEYESQRKYNNRLHHSVIALLKLKQKGVEDHVISHILGLTDKELDEVYERTYNLKLTDLSRNINSKGFLYLKNLEKKISKEKFRKETSENLKPKKLIYIPETFKGLT